MQGVLKRILMFLNNLLLTLVFLHSIGVVEEKDGGVIRCN